MNTTRETRRTRSSPMSTVIAAGSSSSSSSQQQSQQDNDGEFEFDHEISPRYQNKSANGKPSSSVFRVRDISAGLANESESEIEIFEAGNEDFPYDASNPFWFDSMDDAMYGHSTSIPVGSITRKGKPQTMHSDFFNDFDDLCDLENLD